MESFRTIFFLRYPEKKDDRTKSRCDSASDAESRYDRYRFNFVDRDADRLRTARLSDPSL